MTANESDTNSNRFADCDNGSSLASSNLFPSHRDILSGYAHRPQTNISSFTPLLPQNRASDGVITFDADLNDAASGVESRSSFCIDDDDIDVVDAVKVLQRSRNADVLTDFEAYQRNIAKATLKKDKSQRKYKRKRAAAGTGSISRERPDVGPGFGIGYETEYAGSMYSHENDVESQTYGNYFSSAKSAMQNPPLSYDLDKFDGSRQNPAYIRQQNTIDNAFLPAVDEDDKISVAPSVASSYETRDIDEMSDDELLSDEESLLGGSVKRKGLHILRRDLKPRHIEMLAMGGGVGVGIILYSGRAFFTAGPFGTLLAFIIMGLVVFSSFMSFGEMLTLIPANSGLVGLTARFFDDSLAMSLGLLYWCSSAVAIPSEVTAAALTLGYYPSLSVPSSALSVWICFFLAILIIVNMQNLRSFGELHYWVGLGTMLIFISFLIIMFVQNSGAIAPYYEKVGFRYWDSKISDNYGLFRPSYVTSLDMDQQSGSYTIISQITGATGRFLQFWEAMTISSFAYNGTGILFTACGEIRNPRKAIPSATRKIFWRILIFYVLSIFALSINIYSGDARLLALFPTVFSNAPVAAPTDADTRACPEFVGASVWLIALQNAGLCTGASVFAVFTVLISLSTASLHLYASSRIMYSLAVEGFFPKILAKCSEDGAPYVATMVSFTVSFLALMSADLVVDEVFTLLASLCSSASAIVWAGMCLIYIRFYQGLKLRPDIPGRDSELYPFKTPFQPLAAYFGLISQSTVALLLGMTLFLKNAWSTSQFFASYTALIVFVVCYCLHKLITGCKIVPLDKLDFDSCRREIDKAEWKEDRVFSKTVRFRLGRLKRAYLQLVHAFSNSVRRKNHNKEFLQA